MVDGVISLPIALAGYFFIPDVPETSRAFYLSEDVGTPFRTDSSNVETELCPLGSSIFQEENAARRAQTASTVHQGEDTENIDILAHLCTHSALRVSMTLFRLLEPEYIEGAGTEKYRFFNNGAAGAAPVFAQFLKDSKHPKYTIAQINDYPTTTYAVQIITTLLYAWTSDSVLNGDRLPPIVFGGVCFSAIFLSERR